MDLHFNQELLDLDLDVLKTLRHVLVDELVILWLDLIYAVINLIRLFEGKLGLFGVYFDFCLLHALANRLLLDRNFELLLRHVSLHM